MNLRNLIKAPFRWLPRRPGQPIKALPVNNVPIGYVLNDMSTPLVKVINPLPAASPPYTVRDYQGGGFPMTSKEYHAANCYTTITNALTYYRRTVPNFINRWAGTADLRVIPQAGTDLNAFYDRKSLQFFYYGRHEIGGMIFTADSADVVAHELGHAILDAYRPDAFSVASLEVWAFHEAFADWTAITNILSHDEVIQYMLTQTAGNLRQPNIASNLAEQVGKAIYILTGDTARNPDCLRSAINAFVYTDPEILPENAPDNQLAGECHSFGRLFLGVLYEMFVEVYEELLKQWQNPVKAVQEAVAAMAHRLCLAAQNAPLNVQFYETMGKTLLWVENTMFGSTYYDKFYNILLRRKIITPTVKVLGLARCETEDRIVRLSNTIRIKLGDHLIRAQADNPLYDVEVEIPNEQAYFYDYDKNLLDTVLISEEKSLNAAQAMIEYLHKAHQVSDEATTPFAIRNGKLVRTRFF